MVKCFGVDSQESPTPATRMVTCFGADKQNVVAAVSRTAKFTEVDNQEGLAAAARLRRKGSELFKAQRYQEATDDFRKALRNLAKDPVATDASPLAQAVRLNLASSLMRSNSGHQEAISLCDEVLNTEPNNTAALFRRAALRYSLISGGFDDRDLLLSAQMDILHAASNEPGDRQIRELLDTITEALRKPQTWKDVFGEQRTFKEECSSPASPKGRSSSWSITSCSTCGRNDHHCCGKTWWNMQRALWLGLSEDDVGNDPVHFEDEGSLTALHAANRKTTKSSFGLGFYSAILSSASGYWDESNDDYADSDLSDDELDELEKCLECTEGPYPQLKRKIPLATAVHVAVQLWAETEHD